MANFDGPTYTITPGSFREAGWETNNHIPVPWMNAPEFSLAEMGSGGGGGSPSGQDINGYGYSHSG